MPEFHRAGTHRINAFEVDGRFLFKHFFEDDAVFAEIRRYYSPYDYRFEVPADRIAHVRSVLDEHGYALVDVDAFEAFAVVKRKYTDHPRQLFKESVFHRSVGNFNCFVMKDREAVEAAVTAGARRLTETDIEPDW